MQLLDSNKTTLELTWSVTSSNWDSDTRGKTPGTRQTGVVVHMLDGKRHLLNNSKLNQTKNNQFLKV